MKLPAMFKNRDWGMLILNILVGILILLGVFLVLLMGYLIVDEVKAQDDPEKAYYCWVVTKYEDSDITYAGKTPIFSRDYNVVLDGELLTTIDSRELYKEVEQGEYIIVYMAEGTYWLTGEPRQAYRRYERQ